jgi:hypothetical protein
MAVYMSVLIVTILKCLGFDRLALTIIAALYGKGQAVEDEVLETFV